MDTPTQGATPPNDDPMLRLRYYRDTNQQGEAATYEKYLRATNQFRDEPTAHDYHAEYKSGLLAKRMQRENTNDKEMADAQTPGYGTQVLGGIASFLKDVPGGEAAQAAVRSGMSRPDPLSTAAMARHPLPSSKADTPQSYTSALSDIQGAEADAPSAVRGLNSFTGGAAAALAIPGGPMLSGARYGILSGLAKSDPNADLHDRIRSAGMRGTLSALAGKAGDVGITALRGKFAPTLGESALKYKGAIQDADQAAYGQAGAEGAQPQPMPPAVHQAFNEQDIAPFVEVVRHSRTFANADEPTILREAYKLMSERQGTLLNRAGATDNFKAGTSLEKSDIGLAKQQLLNAADPVMPSFRGAVEQHAELAGNRNAFRTMADATNRAIRSAPIPAKKLESNSHEAILEAVRKMKEEAAQAGIDGALGRLRESYHGSANPFKLFGAGPALIHANAAAPYVNALDQQTGTLGSAGAQMLRGGATAKGTSLLSALGLE